MIKLWIWDGALHVFNLAKTLVLVPHKKQKCQVKKSTYKKVGDQKKKKKSSRGSETNPNFHLVNKPSRIGPLKVLQSSLIYTVFYLLVNNNKGRRGGMGIKTKEGGLIVKAFFLWKGGLIRERGRLNRGFKILLLMPVFLPLRCQKKVKSVSIVRNTAIQNVFSTLK